MLLQLEPNIGDIFILRYKMKKELLVKLLKLNLCVKTVYYIILLLVCVIV